MNFPPETDLIPGLAAFIACLVLPLELGIMIGIGINVIFILYHAARPKISIEQNSVSGENFVLFYDSFGDCFIPFYFPAN